MTKVVWTDEATKGLKGIEFYLEMESHEIARKVIDRIERKVNLLTTFPELGRIIPERNDPKFRELIVDGYRVLYAMPSYNEIQIYAIQHSSMKYRHPF